MKKGVCPICGKKVYKVIMYNGKVVGCKYCGINSPWTNADRIRAMTDAELAEWLNCMQSNAYHCGEFGRPNAAYPFNNEEWLKWLKKERSEDG